MTTNESKLSGLVTAIWRSRVSGYILVWETKMAFPKSSSIGLAVTEKYSMVFRQTSDMSLFKARQRQRFGYLLAPT
jgi:hypothetical protein